MTKRLADMTPEQREAKRERDKAYREANRGARRERDKAYREANRETVLAWQKAYREANREAELARHKAYREANREAVRERHKAHYKANREAELAWHKAHYKANHAVYIAASARRRAAQFKATPKWLTVEQHLEIRDKYRYAYAFGCHVDHIEPLRGKNACGLHVPWNLQILDPETNMRKGNKTGFSVKKAKP